MDADGRGWERPGNHKGTKALRGEEKGEPQMDADGGETADYAD